MDFSTILKELREEKGITQKELAKACSLSPQCISALEKGINSPTALTLSSIATYFQVPIDELITREDFTPDERAAGVSETKKISVTPIEEQALNLFRKIGTKHGRETQIEILNMLEKMT